MTATRSALVAAGKTYRTDGISRRVRQITVSAIKEMPLLASKIPGCVSLGQGIPSFPTPTHIVEAACRALRDLPDAGKYTLGPGLPSLREALAGALGAAKGIEVDPERELCVTVGAMEGLLAAMLTVVERGDEVILPSPNYASHIEQVLLAEGIPVFVPLRREDWQMEPDLVASAISPRTRAIVLCNPHNPTGAHFPRSAVEAVVDLAVKHNLFVISDEAYDFLVYGGEAHVSPVSYPEMKDRVIATFSFSKKYAMTGWRLGYVYACEGLLDQMMKIHDALAICAPTVSQYAALAALEGPQECVEDIREALRERRDLACRRLDRLSAAFRYVKPQGAYYLMARFLRPAMDSMRFALRLLHEARVVTVPGEAFGPGGAGHVRLSYGGTPDDIEEAFDRIAAWLEEYSADP